MLLVCVSGELTFLASFLLSLAFSLYRYDVPYSIRYLSHHVKCNVGLQFYFICGKDIFSLLLKSYVTYSGATKIERARES